MNSEIPLKSTRRGFFKMLGGAVAGFSALPAALRGSATERETQHHALNGKYMGDFAAPKIDTVRCAFIGVGARGTGHATRLAAIEGTEIVAICDVYEDLAKRSKKNCEEVGKGQRHKDIQLYYGSEGAWRTMLKEQDIDAVIISTPWKDHAPMAIDSMLNGAHAFVEVPLATTMEDLWKIVEISEKTQRHCMMLENVNYGRTELLYLNMCRQGAIGELLHAEAAYIHELRFQMKEVERGTGSWRTYHYMNRNGNLYPTHGLGPVAQYMNLARGDDNFGSIVSMSSPARGRALYAEKHFPADHKWNHHAYHGGDLNTSIIKTTLGRTVMVQWDETSPRPYTRHNLIQGTQGALAGFPNRVALDEGVPGVTENAHTWAQGEEGLKPIYEKYEHPLYKRMGELSKRMGGHGGMDFLMMYRVVECLQKGAPLDQNVYEGAFWSAVAPLSEKSVEQGGAPQVFPDFTRGHWETTQPLGIIG